MSVPQIEEAYPAAVPAGTMTEVRPDLWWLRLPLAGVIDHVNTWLLRGPQGWTLLDFGTDSSAVQAIWQSAFADKLRDAPVERLVATHGHVDHMGYAGPVGERYGLPLHATRTEWLVASLRRVEALHTVPDYVAAFFARHGCGPEHTASFEAGRRRFADEMAEPPPLKRLVDGELLTMGGREWRVMVNGGHAPEHASFWCERDGILIAGDQILPRTSPSLGVLPSEPDADPLGDYLASLDRLWELPADTFILSSHGVPFRGLHNRIEAVRERHSLRLGEVHAALDRPRTANEVAHLVYAKGMQDGRARLVFGEALARLNHLVSVGLARAENDGGRQRFVALRD
ncbi:MAG TPA: MBL fold metallo-hydrolase [Devosia sp.]|nr:MBL fold metallo-hydrolase [Devosia sp.]